MHWVELFVTKRSWERFSVNQPNYGSCSSFIYIYSLLVLNFLVIKYCLYHRPSDSLDPPLCMGRGLYLSSMFIKNK